MAMAFCLMWIGLVAQKSYTCYRNHCTMKSAVGIAQLVTDTISDIVLVIIPLCMLRGAKLPKNERILISCVFSASLLISLVSVVLSVFLCTAAPAMWSVIVAHVQAALSLSVCNLLVIATFAYRVFREFRSSALVGSTGGDSNAVRFTTVVSVQAQLTSHPSCDYRDRCNVAG
ncbi:hypothetical protein BJ138DRAFT_728866 [Hygrophoropsis aurantiaca]|uniref:Uncharacterized protein n=1 Tax=Hygrophoropsis aurantiaca TaxID=72124 RepID=A0ACB7ZXG0_9AGAM|nr:hypothetical protein BJ138DRAFT_728866 [Hygrophoropsis aurantiaca]